MLGRGIIKGLMTVPDFASFRDLSMNDKSNRKPSAKNVRKKQVRKEVRFPSLDQSLERTSAMWNEGDALTYQRRVRNEWHIPPRRLSVLGYLLKQ
jgi:hypothetical protein